MRSYHNLHIIGTSHIAKQSIDEITKAFDTFKPDIVAVELDRQRLHGLMSETQGKPSYRDIRRIGFKGFVFALLGSWANRKLGKIVGISPGSEMKTAVQLAKKHSSKIALIDQNIEITLKRFSKSLSWREKWNFFVDIFNSLILRKKDPLLNFDLKKVPEKKIISMMIQRVKERYPNIHKVLIEERNYYMTRKLKKLMSANPASRILAVVGAGHEDSIIDILKENEGITYSFTVTK